MSLLSQSRPPRATFRWRAAVRVLAVGGAVMASGCGTIMRDGMVGKFTTAPVYPATQFDIAFIGDAVSHSSWGEGVIKVVGGILDLPVSLVTDTILFPWDLRSYRRAHGSWKGERISIEGTWGQHYKNAGDRWIFSETYPGYIHVFDAPKSGAPKAGDEGRLDATLQWNEKDHYFVRWPDIRWTPLAPPPAPPPRPGEKAEPAVKTADPGPGESKK